MQHDRRIQGITQFAFNRMLLLAEVICNTFFDALNRKLLLAEGIYIGWVIG